AQKKGTWWIVATKRCGGVTPAARATSSTAIRANGTLNSSALSILVMSRRNAGRRRFPLLQGSPHAFTGLGCVLPCTPSADLATHGETPGLLLDGGPKGF